MSRHNRIHYMDNLRAFAMILGVFFHAAIANGPMLEEVWLTASPQNSALFDIFAYFAHAFRMPLFFLIAGFFAALLVNKRGLGAMLKNRLLRVTLPFIIFLPLVVISFAILIGWAMENVEHKSPMLQFFSLMAQNPSAPEPPLTTAHLWFLYYLTFFYLITAVLVRFVKFNWMRFITASPKLFVFLGPLLLVPALVTQYSPTPAPDKFILQLWSFGFFGVFYMLGWGLFKHESLLKQLKPFAWFMLVTSIIAFAIFYTLIAGKVSLQEAFLLSSTSPELNVKQLSIAVLQAYIGMYMCLTLLIFGSCVLNKQSKPVKFIADSSYWVYIVHMPVLWWIQFLLLDTQVSMLAGFIVSSFGTIFIGMMTYLLLVRWTPIGWLLNGRKKRELKT